MRQWYGRRYPELPTPIEKSLHRWLLSFDRAAKQLLFSLIVFLAVTALSVLARWVPSLGIFSGALTLMWYVSLVALFSYPWWGGKRWVEALNRYRLVRDELTLAGIEPRDLWTLLETPKTKQEQSPVSILSSEHFAAGGRAWSFESLSKNLIVFGQPGSGKTSCVLNSLLEGVVGSTADTDASLLLLDPKGDFSEKLPRIATKYGRADDVLVLDPHRTNEAVRWNPLDSDDDEFEIAERFGGALEVLGLKDAQSSFWLDKSKQFIQNALILKRAISTEPPSLEDLGRLASSRDRILEDAKRVPESNAKGMGAVRYFAEEWFTLPEETLGGIHAHISSMVNPFTSEPYRTFFSGRSTVRVGEAIDGGKMLLLSMPVAQREGMARVVGTLLKLEYFREILRRPNKRVPSIFFCDEFQVFFNGCRGRGDSDFFERSRQSFHTNIIACQNLQSLFKQVDRRESALNLLGNCAIKLFLRNADAETNQYAADLFGKALFGMTSTSAGNSGPMSKVGGGSSVSSGDQFDHVVRPERFVSLAIPDRGASVQFSEGIIHDATSSSPSSEPRMSIWRINLV
jgi:hypothetical protein